MWRVFAAMMGTMTRIHFSTVLQLYKIKNIDIELFLDGESVAGDVVIRLKRPGHRFEHQGIRIDLIGQIGIYFVFKFEHLLYFIL